MRDIFEKKVEWGKYGLTSDYKERAELLLKIIPKDAKSLIDIGCGKGEFINNFSIKRTNVKTIGTDLSFNALKYVTVPKVLSKLPNIPFKDRTFDVVVCLQVLEHIDSDYYQSSLNELQRLSKKYLIIGVPYKENIRTKLSLCDNCGHTSNSDGHLRSFELSTLNNLFSDYFFVKHFFCGFKQKRRSNFGVFLKQKIANIYYYQDLFYCDKCGYSNSLKIKYSRYSWRRFFSLFELILSFFKFKYPYWVISIYHRKLTL